jgi:chemotaxis protein CheX
MDTRLYDPFENSVKDIFMQMAGIEISLQDGFYPEIDEITSYGVSSIISFVGKIKGRLLLDMEKSLALAIAKNITGTEYTSTNEYMVLASISELNNIISGDGITQLNNLYSLSLRLAPPIVFSGKDAVICIPKISSVSLNCMTPFGNLKVNAAFERSL